MGGDDGEEGRVMNQKSGAPEPQERFPWAGPVLFTAVLVLVITFFWWFVQA